MIKIIVAVLALFKENAVDINVNSIVFGESILNDAVAIILYGTIIGYRAE